MPALQALGTVGLLSHEISLVPYLRETNGWPPVIRIGTLPLTVHGEALLAGRVHRARLRAWDGAWAVGSRHAGALLTAGVPYAVWEATTVRDELRAVRLTELWRSGRGTGIGTMLHRAILPLGDRLERLVYRRATLLFAMSEYSRQLIVDTHDIPEDRIEILPAPPARTFLDTLSSAKSGSHARQNDSTELRLLFVGRVDDPRKHFALLVAAVKRLRQRGVAVHLTVVGPHTPKWYAALQKSEMGGAVTVLGRISVPSLVAAYCSHDLLVVPSRQEGYGLVVAEALHAGLPVVATRCGGPEGMIRASTAGILTDHTVEAFSEAIERLATRPDQRMAMSRRATTFAGRELSLSVFHERVASATARLLSARRPRAA